MSIRTSIVVLPFKNFSTDGDNEFFCDGITEEIIHALSKIDQLKVTSRNSSFFFKDNRLPTAEIGEKLDVGVLLEGSVRFSGAKMRISAQLIDVKRDEQFWSNSWDRSKDDIFAVQDEVSLSIADVLREFYGHLEIADHLSKAPSTSITAYELFLKGRHHFYKWNPEDTGKAIDYFEQAISLDADLIDAYLGLADSYSFMAVAGFAPREEAQVKAQHALDVVKQKEPENAVLNYLQGSQTFFVNADFAAAYKYGRQAIQSKPTYAEGHCFMSFLCTLNGELGKAKEHIQYAKSIDPLNQETRFFEANYLYRVGKYEGSKTILDQLLEENPANLPAIAVKCYLLLKTQRFDEAESFIEQIPEQMIAPDERIGLIGVSKAMQGFCQIDELSLLEQKADDEMAHHAHSYLFIIYSNLGEFDKALEVANKIEKHKSSILLLGITEPMASPIHSDVRYQALLKRIYQVNAAKTSRSNAESNSAKPDIESLKAFESKLNEFVEAEQPYLNPTINLRLLADQIELHPNQLSLLLNELIGKNFNQYINELRIAHFKQLVIDPSNNHISLLGLAFESGFNSKTVFNTTFKKLTRMTPKAFQMANQNR